jgi:carbamoyltransferase
MIIIGINAFGHDSSASLIIDDILVFAVEEERLTRKKHDGQFPMLSIQACLDFAKITISDIDHITFFWKPSLTIKHIPVYFFKFFSKVPKLLKEQRNFEVEENLGMLNYIKDMYGVPKHIRNSFPNGKNAKFKFHYIEHHLCHAASTFYPSTFNDAAILTIDGAGEWATTLMAHGKGTTIKKLATINTPYSLGAFYQAISMHLGFKLIEGPGKLMALASFGNPNGEIYNQLRSLFTFEDNGKYSFDMSYFSYHYSRKSGVSKKFNTLFGTSKIGTGNWNQEQMDLAASAQRIVEELFLHMGTYLKKATNSENICLAGGVALNSVANGKLVQSGLFKNIFIQPAAGDSGTSLGSAFYLNHQILKRERKFVMETAFLGNKYSNEEYENELKKSQLKYVDLGENIYRTTAKILNQNYIIGWFQGAMEYGPRALGNRSILASPFPKDMKDTINNRIKFRESFRPFAAIVNEEECDTYFTHHLPNPYMLLVYGVKKEYQQLMPAITHVDGTVRIQTVNEKENPNMRKLLNEFKAISGHPVVLNTSFNIKAEPIVCSPKDAVNSFVHSDLDYLVIGNFLVTKGLPLEIA